ncbi:MAG: serine hydrolase [Alphaproteobacteria bacterium]|nr:serine hydrolase [Alphaproteobacteria bacterium]
MVEFLMGRGANALAVLLSCIVLLIAAFLGWIGYRDAALGAYVGAGILVVLALLIPRSLRVANQWERAIVLRLGKLQAIRGPGLFFIVPFIDTIAVFIDQRIQTTQFNAERTLTRDTVPVNVDAIIFWQVHDTERAALEIADYRQAIGQVAQTSLREMIGATELSGLLSERKKADKLLGEVIGTKTAEWGVAVISVEIRDVAIPPGLQDAMSRKAQAEREREARIILGSSEQQVAQTFVDAARIYASTPGAMQLRAMNLVYEATKERGMTIVVPSAMADSMNAGGLAGLLNAAGKVAAILLVLGGFALAPIAAWAQAGPVFSDTGPNADAYGAAEDYPIPPKGKPATAVTKIGWNSHYDQLTPVRRVAKSETPSPLKRAAEEIQPSYPYGGRVNTIADYLDHNPVMGLLIARDDTILFEHYQYARTDKDRFLSYSMVKTITGLLVGIAVSEGAIRSIDDTAATYVPELAGTEYGATPIRALLHMSSGVRFRETYQPGDDIFKLQGALLWPGAVGAIPALKQFNTRDAAPGTRFSYASAETEVLGLVVSHAVHMTLADYLSARIWQKLGAESDAAWAFDPTGQEVAYCCFVAVLRDWARLGLMLAHDGVWNGQQIVPRQWLHDATTIAPTDDYLRLKTAGYGYQIWLLPGQRRMFALAGAYGQAVLVDPDAKLVMVQTAVRPKPIDPGSNEGLALWYALVAQYGGP